ncbi:hypothetical protein ACH5RR_037549 [Cinchona calisaya]|uniref:Uncharacterized protein n=1 Tax=Cinchona calisaya TaxID=153742 RepID=A0ABD2YA87_9GENT
MVNGRKTNLLPCQYLELKVNRQTKPAAGKLLKSEKKGVATSLEDSLVLSALPKGSLEPNVVNEKHFRIAFPAAHVEPNLQSVPSPGIGH